MYTGDEIASYHLYAQVFTSLLVTMTYSGGLPILYAIAFLNFFFLYWIYKVLLIKFYQKTIAFNQDLAFASIKYFKIGVFIHLIMTAFMFTNRDILVSNTLTQFQDDAL